MMHPHKTWIAFPEFMNDAPLDRYDAIGISGMVPLTPMQWAATAAMFLFMGAALYLAWRWR